VKAEENMLSKQDKTVYLFFRELARVTRVWVNIEHPVSIGPIENKNSDVSEGQDNITSYQWCGLGFILALAETEGTGHLSPIEKLSPCIQDIIS
jgi:hypothetical protein